ncbi:MAG: class I SAM-dependent methyltransferase [Acidobacteriota bacterium]
MPSLIYRSSFVYELSMMVLYGRHYGARYRAIADLIKTGSTVLDLCCGPAILYQRHLREKSVAYIGIDINERFVQRVIESGALGRVGDLRSAEPLPQADYVLMQASLYHFLPDPLPVLRRMREAAKQAVIIAEPVRNLTSSGLPMLGSFSSLLTDAGNGAEQARFNEQTLDELITDSFGGTRRSFLIEGGREKVYVLNVI